ncbi:MAG: class III poly(R)-hydroxyalkanoic acid synthase subunit PhaE [Gammaproteobacteria bacterium]|nr:class III poly(R)-hydroxyalkanoic acid synthase subunit PhaE [Gammaproteobacteria bacterium]
MNDRQTSARTNSKTSASITDSRDWLVSQQKYWDAWLNFTRQTLSNASGSKDTAAATWVDNLSSWHGAISAAVPSTARDFFEQMMLVCQSYLTMAQRLVGGDPQNPGTVLDQWLSNLQSSFSAVSETTTGRTDRRLRNARALWDMPFDTWQRTWSSMLPLPGDYLQAVQDEGMARVSGRLSDRIDRFLAIPAVGYSREAQDQHQRFLRLMLDYGRTLQESQLGFARVGTQSIENFRRKLSEQPADAPIDTLRKLYDLWVDACEEIYAKYVMSEEYSLLHGRLVNTLMAVKHHGSLLVDEMLEGMNMPTRREVNSMHRRMHETRRENHALRAEIEQIKELLEDKTPAGAAVNLTSQVTPSQTASAPTTGSTHPPVAPDPSTGSHHPRPRGRKSKNR